MRKRFLFLSAGVIILAIPFFYVAYYIHGYYQRDHLKSKITWQMSQHRILLTELNQYHLDFGMYPENLTFDKVSHYDIFNVKGEQRKRWMFDLPVGTSGYQSYTTTISPITYCVQDDGFVLISVGPDKVPDLDCSNLDQMTEKTYDVTNGLISSGDMVRIWKLE